MSMSGLIMAKWRKQKEAEAERQAAEAEAKAEAEGIDKEEALSQIKAAALAKAEADREKYFAEREAAAEAKRDEEAKDAEVIAEAEKKFGHLGKVWAKGGKVRLYFSDAAAEAIREKEGGMSNNKFFKLRCQIDGAFYDIKADEVRAETSELCAKLRQLL